MMEADNRAMYPVDMYAFGSIKRSLAHCKGFATLIDTKNLTCGGGILRMQLDTLLRFFAVFIVDEPHAFASSVMHGKQVKEHKDRLGNKMNDAYLVRILSKEYPWIESVYKETSGYVHFSSKHIFAAMESVASEDRTITFQLSSDDVERAEQFYDEAITAFYHITEIFLLYLEGWVRTKANPELVLAAKQKLTA